MHRKKNTSRPAGLWRPITGNA